MEQVLLEKLIRIVGISIAGFVSLRLVDRFIFVFFSRVSKKSAKSSYRNRLTTLRSITAGLVHILIVSILLLIIAADIGWNILPILTGAGVVGFAISFGAQAVIRDMISGFFILLDNNINVGDTVKIGEEKGKIVKILMRKIVIRDENGNLVFIPTSEVKNITLFKEL